MVLDDNTATLSIVDFVPKQLALTDPVLMSPGEMLTRARRVQSLRIETLSENVLAYVQSKQDQYWSRANTTIAGDDHERQRVAEEYESLDRFVQSLIGAPLGRTPAGITTIFGKPLGVSLLSAGQKVLLQLAIAIHAAPDTNGCVLTLDEPENHLHPAAVISVFDKILTALPTTQLWIATHSLPLIAHLYAKDRNSINFVADGMVTHAGRKPEIVLKGLLGGEAEQSQLLNFIDLPYNVASSQFAAACLVSPTVAEHRRNDPQLQQIREILRAAKVDSQPLKILDLGAGTGRLLGGLAEESPNASSDFDYVGYDVTSINRAACEAQIAAVYESSHRRWFSNPDELFAAHMEGGFDVVVLCNVLHEIAPDDWLSIVGRSGLVYRALSAAGHLLLVEDLRMPVGELPNSRGFFLLDPSVSISSSVSRHRTRSIRFESMMHAATDA